jgi:hypothetical protein
MRSHRHLYRFPTASVVRIAYYFEFDRAAGAGREHTAVPLVEATRRWMSSGARGGLWVTGTERATAP